MSDRPLSLHQLSALELSPTRLIQIAAAAGFERVCVFVQGSSKGFSYPRVTRDNAREVGSALSDTGVQLHNLEVFALTSHVSVQDYRPALELGAELGARRATAILFDPDDGRASESFARFADLTAELGIKAGLEFMAFSSVKTLNHALRIVRAAGSSNGTVAVDTLHLMRNGSGPAELAQADPRLIGSVQLCDGPATIDPALALREALENRLPPGQGEFPLRQIVACLPEDRCVSLEVPMDRRREEGMDAITRARLLNVAARAILPGASAADDAQR